MSYIARKLLIAYQEEEECDVKLQLKSGKILQCHSIVLKLSSDFFKTRLSSTWSKGGNSQEIDCTSFDDFIVKDVINFMYGVSCDLNEKTVPQFLECCTYFMVFELTSLCEDVLLNSLQNRNVVDFYLLSNLYGLEKLSDACLKFFDSHTEHVESENFLKLSKELLIKIISRDTLSVHEHHLFKILKTWVEIQDETDCMWNDIRPYIRFCSMTFDFFVANCVIGNISEQNWGKLLLYLSSTECQKSDLTGLSINTKSRQIESTSDIFAQRFILNSSSPDWQTDCLDGDRLTLSSDTDIFLKAVSLYGLPNTSLFTSLSIYDFESKVQLTEVYSRLEFETKETAFVRLESSLHIEANKRYTLVSRPKKAHKTFFGKRGVATFAFSQRPGPMIKITFVNANGGNTNVQRGQFHGFLFKPIN